MRFFILILLFLIPTLVFAEIDEWNTVDSTRGYQLIGDSVHQQNGTVCHIDNFVEGTCTEEDSWDFSFFNFWIGLLLPFAFFGYIVVTIKRKMNRKKVE